MFLSHSSKPVITTCVCDLCLQERGKADGNIDQCEYTYCVQTKQHFSRHAMLRSMTESCSSAGSVAHIFVFFVFVFYDCWEKFFFFCWRVIEMLPIKKQNKNGPCIPVMDKASDDNISDNLIKSSYYSVCVAALQPSGQ